MQILAFIFITLFTFVVAATALLLVFTKPESRVAALIVSALFGLLCGLFLPIFGLPALIALG